MAATREIKVDIVGRTRDRELEGLAYDLIDAMARMHGNFTFSANVCRARDELRDYLHGIAPAKRDPADEAKAA